MTSHYRHRRDSNPTVPFANPLEKGEIAVNTANRQIAVGDTGGAPLALIAVRYFDPKSQYLLNDFVVHDADLYVALDVIQPGPFNAAQWRLASNAPGDTSNLANYLLLAGGIMTGPLILHDDPTDDLGAATKGYVDDSTPPPPAAAGVPVTPTGGIAANNVQAALAELDAEKVAIAGSTMTGHLALPTNPGAPNAVRKDYVDAADSTNAAALASKVNKAGDTMTGTLSVGGDVYANRSPTTGVLYLGSNATHYLHFDGSSYRMPSGSLVVGGDVNAVGGVFGGQLVANAGSSFSYPGNHTLYNNGVNFASATPSSVQVQGPPYPTIAFHCAGYFGANFGMSTDGQFYMGGWSHGQGVYYRLLTTREGEPVTQTRLVYVGDYVHSSDEGLTEPFGATACNTGNSGAVPSGYPGGSYITARYRVLQVKTASGYYASEVA
jgi:hypothetical protein